MVCKSGLGFSVHLHKPRRGLQLRGGLRELGCHCAAWPAPGRPEIHHHRDVVALDVLLKIDVAKVSHVAREESLMAMPAPGLRTEAHCRYAVDRLTVRTHDM